jgi:cytosol alanyl aminopeptidase
VRLLRPELVRTVAERGEDAVLQKEALALAGRWLASPSGGGVAPEMVPVVLRLAGRQADAALNEQLHAALAREGDRRVRRWILEGLGAVTQPALQQQNLQLVLAPEVDVREGLGVLGPMLALPATRQAAYDFLEAHYDAIAGRMPPEMAIRLARYGEVFCDEAHRKDVEDFFGPRTGQLPGGRRVLEQTLEVITQCMAVRQAQGDSIALFLKRY